VTASAAATARREHAVQIAGAALAIDAAGALYWPEERMLIVADLHFEKGSSYARRGQFLPPYDTAATLARLTQLVARYAPRRIVALGDSFHDVGGGDRLGQADLAALLALQAGRDWLWIAGNHDPITPARCGGTALDELHLGPLVLRHAPQAGAVAGEIAGHLHPVARVAGQSGIVRRRCLATNGSRCILPAFGAYAGGLNLCDPAFAPLFQASDVYAHVLGRTAVYRVPSRRCLPE
jgi:DNA ligase-associated metallophosphoesterase